MNKINIMGQIFQVVRNSGFSPKTNREWHLTQFTIPFQYKGKKIYAKCKTFSQMGEILMDGDMVELIAYYPEQTTYIGRDGQKKYDCCLMVEEFQIHNKPQQEQPKLNIPDEKIDVNALFDDIMIDKQDEKENQRQIEYDIEIQVKEQQIDDISQEIENATTIKRYTAQEIQDKFCNNYTIEKQDEQIQVSNDSDTGIVNVSDFDEY